MIEDSNICHAISYADGEPIQLEEDSTGKDQQCQVREGYMDEHSMSKKLKKEIARAEAEAPQPDTDTVEEYAQPAPLDVQLKWIEEAEAAKEAKKKAKKKAKAKNKAKGKKKK